MTLSKITWQLLSWGVAIFALGPGLIAQKRPASDSLPHLRSDVTLILVPVTVLDRRGAIVNGLTRNSFAVLDNKISQKIVSFSNEDAPCSVGLVLDLSASMRNQLDSAKYALNEFLRTADPSDEFSLFGVTTRPLLYTVRSLEDFTPDAGAIQNQIRVAAGGGDTALVDTVYAALLRMRHAHNPRRALVIVSDGMDNHSRYSKEDLIRLAVEADVQMYTIAIFTAPRESKPVQQVEARNGLNFLEDLSARTGGVHFVVQGRKEASEAAERIGSAIRNQYVIGFQPRASDQTGKWHRVQVTLDRQRVQVYARSGYYAR